MPYLGLTPEELAVIDGHVQSLTYRFAEVRPLTLAPRASQVLSAGLQAYGDAYTAALGNTLKPSTAAQATLRSSTKLEPSLYAAAFAKTTGTPPRLKTRPAKSLKTANRALHRALLVCQPSHPTALRGWKAFLLCITALTWAPIRQCT
jgi:hypothetical protein